MARHTTMELCSVFVRVQWVCFFSLFLCRLLQHLFWFRWNFICCGPLNSWFIGLQTGVLSLSLIPSLHWLPVTHCIQYKISSVCPHSKYWFTTSFLGGRCRKVMLGVCCLPWPYTPTRQLRSAPTETFGERVFLLWPICFGAVFLNTVRHSDLSSSFKTDLKTHLFTNAF